MVADHAAREADLARPWCPIRDVSDGGGGDSSNAVPDDSATDCPVENQKWIETAENDTWR